MPTLTIKNIPDELYQRLKIMASENHRSINRQVIVYLEQGVAKETKDASQIITSIRQLRERIPIYITDKDINRLKNMDRP
jgi:antitoxin FitA